MVKAFRKKKVSEMFTSGGTGGGPGAAGYNLSLAQFQQRVADAQIDCVKCKKGKLGKAGAIKACKAFVFCRYCTPETDTRGRRRNCCDLSVSSVSSQRSCSSRSCACPSVSVSTHANKAGKEEKVVA